LIDWNQAIGSDLAGVGELDHNAGQRTRAELDDEHAATNYGKSRGKPIVEQAMRCDRQRHANNRQGLTPRPLLRRADVAHRHKL
jgi:hypothetical protein